MRRAGTGDMFGAGPPGVVKPRGPGRPRGWRKPAEDPTREVVARGRTLFMSYSDFIALRAMGQGRMPVKGAERQFRRLQGLGLVRARFEQVRDWPVAMIALTEDGAAILAQGFPPE